MSKFAVTFAATPEAVKQSMKELPTSADLGGGIRQYAHYFSGDGRMSCVFEAPSEKALRGFFDNIHRTPTELFRVDYEWDRATGKFLSA